MKKSVKLDRTEALFTAYALQEYMRNYDESSDERSFLDALLFKIEKFILGKKATTGNVCESDTVDVKVDNMSTQDGIPSPSTFVPHDEDEPRTAHTQPMFPMYMQFSDVRCVGNSKFHSWKNLNCQLTFRKAQCTSNLSLEVRCEGAVVMMTDICEVKYDNANGTLLVFESSTFPSMDEFVLSKHSDREFCKVMMNNGTIYKKTQN